jgi:hypothetical protein
MVRASSVNSAGIIAYYKLDYRIKFSYCKVLYYIELPVVQNCSPLLVAEKWLSKILRGAPPGFGSDAWRGRSISIIRIRWAGPKDSSETS